MISLLAVTGSGVARNLEVANLVFGLISSIGGIAVALLAIYVGKRLAEERLLRAKEREEDRKDYREAQEKLSGEIRSLAARFDKEFLQHLLDIGEKYSQKAEVSERIGEVNASVKAAHKRIDEIEKSIYRRRADGSTP